MEFIIKVEAITMDKHSLIYVVNCSDCFEYCFIDWRMLVEDAAIEEIVVPMVILF